ncbi:TIGR03826 family flagellar region protein [Bacillus sinesaloumensis]|uniref:TIGR03826 family flagellar region protein n=1 Tax=Litchfieldia sinesaloumensis TaxID=1926280 RepID=UPI000988356E|nr:TIGR03826 family flagellar region protein [Bacillus sinesaloumensis]
MGELMNCPNCGGLFVKTNLRDVCEKCYKEEQMAFETVYTFIRKRENRTATILEASQGTGVDEELIIKFIRTGKLKLAQFPNLGYPCQKCSTLIREGNLCDDCAKELRTELSTFEKEEERLKELREREKRTYFVK